MSSNFFTDTQKYIFGYTANFLLDTGYDSEYHASMKLQTRIKRILTVAIGKRLEPGWRRDAANGIGKNYTYLSRVLNGRIETPGAVDCVDRLEKWIEAK